MNSPQWGYAPDGRAGIFDGDIPAGWSPVPPFDLSAEEWTRRMTDGTGGVPGGVEVPVEEPAPVKRGPGRPRKDAAEPTPVDAPGTE